MYTFNAASGKGAGRRGLRPAAAPGMGGCTVKRGVIVLLAALGAGQIGGAGARALFEPGTRMTMGPTLAKDVPAAAPQTAPAPTPPAPTTAAPAMPMPTAAEQATAAARSVVRKVDPTMRSLIIRREEMDSNRAKTAGGAAPASQSQASPTNRQEKKIGAGADSAKGDDAAKEVQQVQRGLLNDQKVNVGVAQ